LTELAADLPQVKADRIELQQVVMNLIINGIESMRNTDRARELAIELLRSETGKVPVSVGDTGVGMRVWAGAAGVPWNYMKIGG
jgi:C4-dicarboxylate-specific signal transduction histidine kinase